MTPESIAAEILAEYRRAAAKFPPMRSPHEGWAILEEEVLELRDEIFHGTPERAREEAAQVGAMALRLMLDCLGGER